LCKFRAIVDSGRAPFLDSTTMPKVLVVDDDPHIRDIVRFALSGAGFAVVEAADGLAAIDAFRRERPDLVVLDILMPELDGTEVCRRLRRETATPIVFLSSRDDEVDRIVGLEIGGDDYVTKPFSPRELVARVKAVLRRQQPREAAEPRLVRRGELELDLDACTAVWRGRTVPLTATEFGVLKALAAHPGKVFSRENLMAAAYDDHRYVSDRTIDSHIRRIRAKFGDPGGVPIETAHGFGYRLMVG
jgi:two-component system, OmpR family, response regulator